MTILWVLSLSTIVTCLICMANHRVHGDTGTIRSKPFWRYRSTALPKPQCSSGQNPEQAISCAGREGKASAGHMMRNGTSRAAASEFGKEQTPIKATGWGPPCI
jgi:hypothetical protein